jgi:hypothetical protein
LFFPCGDFADEALGVVDSAIQALAAEHADLDLDVVELQAAPLSSSSPDTQRRLVSYPPNLESAAAPATARLPFGCRLIDGGPRSASDYL